MYIFFAVNLLFISLVHFSMSYRHFVNAGAFNTLGKLASRNMSCKQHFPHLPFDFAFGSFYLLKLMSWGHISIMEPLTGKVALNCLELLPTNLELVTQYEEGLTDISR